MLDRKADPGERHGAPDDEPASSASHSEAADARSADTLEHGEDAMNMMTNVQAAVSHHGATVAMHCGAPPITWGEALADYLAKRDASDHTPDDAAGVDEKVDEYCDAMDHLIDNVVAPGVDEIRIKFHLAQQRSQGFEGLHEDHRQGIVADLVRLAPDRFDGGDAPEIWAFALAWLQRWTRRGGSVSIDPTSPDKAWFGQLEYHVSPVYDDDEALIRLMQERGLSGLDEKTRAWMVDYRRTENRARHEGAMSELRDLLNVIDGGAEAIKATVRLLPAAGYPAGWSTRGEEVG